MSNHEGGKSPVERVQDAKLVGEALAKGVAEALQGVHDVWKKFSSVRDAWNVYRAPAGF